MDGTVIMKGAVLLFFPAGTGVQNIIVALLCRGACVLCRGACVLCSNAL